MTIVSGFTQRCTDLSVEWFEFLVGNL